MLELSRRALAGDAQAQAQLRQIGATLRKALANPVDTVSQSIRDELALADRLDILGRHDEATQVRSKLVTSGVLSVTGAGAVAVKGGQTIGRWTGRVGAHVDELAGEAVRGSRVNNTGGIPKLPPSKPSSLNPGALEPHEIAQAQSIVDYKGGNFIGAPTKNYPGIDGWLDGIPVQLKEVTGNGMMAVQRNIVGGARDMHKAGYIGDMYIDITRTGVSIKTLNDWVKPNTPIANILNESTVKNIYVRTSEGWVDITKTTLKFTGEM